MRVKQCLWAVAVFFFSFIVFVLAAAAGYYLYFNCLWLAAGAPAELQPPLLFLEGIFAVWNPCAIAALLPVVFYFIRKSVHPAFSLSAWFFICLMVFALLQPLSFMITARFSAYTALHRVKNPVYIEHADTTVFTPGFFREFGDGIYYFTEINKRLKSASGVKLTVLAGRTSVRPAVIFDKDEAVFAEISNVSDPLIEKTVVLPRYGQICIKEIQSLLSIGQRAFLVPGAPFSPQFFWAYLGFSSIGLAILGFFAFTGFSSWKLLNVLFLPVCCALVLHINFLVQCGGWLDPIKGFFSFLPAGIPDGFYAAAVNVLIFAILLIAGLFGSLRKQAEAADE